ncbi:MAG: threonine--tRNA ligase [Defluviitaleaceae bacterium]|nr:threonine--tRNA ligase [Defluviitaleaceae bacterium]
MAQAVKRLYPSTKLAIGPAIADGFYYDFETAEPFGVEDLKNIEKEMKKIVKEKLPIESFKLSKAEALEKMKGEPYKLELIEELAEEPSFYKQGEFVDLCAGPHMETTRDVKAFKLLSTAGAYWRSDEKNKMLSRIYGTAFFTKDELAEHLHKLEEAKKRDHNKIGRELKIFATAEEVGQGLPLLMPNGAKMLQILQRLVEDEEEKRGYILTKTPMLAKSDLYKLSGHWDLYKDGMFVMGDEEKDSEVMALRPMTCPFQFMIYKADQHSYRDLPIRFNETSTLFRNESSGEMHGLIRVRQFTLSEGHLICTREQLKDELVGVVDLINYFMAKLGIEKDITYRFSKWDPNNKEKYIGDAELWEEMQDTMRAFLQDMNIDFVEAEGEAAFYGPKLDIQFKNVHGKEDTAITVQIDFGLAERFDMTYIDTNDEKQHPIIIHRSSIGCYERTLAFLIEKYAGWFPLWLAPVQAIVVPISEKHHEAAQAVYKQLLENGIRARIDVRTEKIGYKIRSAQMQRIPYMLVLGDREVEEGTVSVRAREDGQAVDKGAHPVADVVTELLTLSKV